jgi:hypothetical protein
MPDLQETNRSVIGMIFERFVEDEAIFGYKCLFYIYDRHLQASKL